MSRAIRWKLVLAGMAAAIATAASILFFANAVPQPMRVVEPITTLAPIDSEGFRHLQRTLLGGRALAGNRIEILKNGEEIFASKLDAIDNASSTITLETYEYWGEEIGAAFAEALAGAARRGVAVRAIFDYLGSVKADPDKFDQMTEAGVEVIRWRQPSWYQLARFNYRTHRKLLIVDGRIGFTGGANTADAWKGSPETGGYRDNHYRFEGPVVAGLQNAFALNWLNATGQLLYGLEYFPVPEPRGDLDVKVVNSSPGEGTHRIRLMMLLAIAGAREHVRMATPYFYPDNMIMDALLDARRRGISVDLLLPTEGEYSRAVRQASMNRWGDLLEAGVRIHEYLPSKFHAKLYIIDDYWVSIGSSNLDNRSFRLNDETNVIIMDRELAGMLTELFDQDLEQSRTYDLETWKDRPRIQRLLGWVAMTIGWHL